MTDLEIRTAAIHRWIAKRNIVEIKPVVLQASNGKFACMVSFKTACDGAVNILHMGFTKYRATADRIATATAIGFASL